MQSLVDFGLIAFVLIMAGLIIQITFIGDNSSKNTRCSNCNSEIARSSISCVKCGNFYFFTLLIYIIFYFILLLLFAIALIWLFEQFKFYRFMFYLGSLF